MDAVVQLARHEEVPARPFTSAANTARDESVMRLMLARMRALAPSWLEHQAAGVLIHEPDSDGHRHWIRVPDRDALFAASQLAVVGFFGKARDGVDHTLIHDLEGGIVDTLERIPGVLSYYDVALPGGGYGNLILCDDASAPRRVHDHELHRRAVELTPRHYSTVRLHTGAIAGRLLSEAPLVVRRTRYYDFDSEPAWLAARDVEG